MFSICVSTNLYKGMFQGTKIHIIIQIPIIYAPKKQKNDARRTKFFHYSSKSLPPAVTQPPPLIRSFALENTSMKPRLSREGK